ncbi:hypothetical protein Tco_1204780 [Tanacetum coccineum]
MKSITEERARVFIDLIAEEKERYKDDIVLTIILLQGSELTKDDRESQFMTYEVLNALCQIKETPFHGYWLGFRSSLTTCEHQDGSMFQNALTIRYDTMRNNQGRPSSRGTIARGKCCSWDMLETRCAHELLMEWCGTDEKEQSVVYLQDEQVPILMDDVFEADQCDALDSDVYEAPNHTRPCSWQVQAALYNGHVLVWSISCSPVVHDSEGEAPADFNSFFKIENLEQSDSRKGQHEDLEGSIRRQFESFARSSVKTKVLAPGIHEMCVVNILNSVNATPTVKIVLNKGKQIWKPKGKLSDNSLNKTKQIWQPKGKLSDNSLNKTKQIWQPKGKLSDNSLNKTKQVWKATGKLFANVGYQWRPTGKKFTSGKLNCGYQWRPTGKKFALGELCPLTRIPVTCCLKLDLEEEMAPVRISSGPEPQMMFGQNSSSLVLHQMMSAQISSGLAPQCLKMFEHSSSSLGLHCQKTFKQISSNLVSQMSQRRLLASLQAPFLKEKKGVRFSALYLQQKRNLLVLDHSHQQIRKETSRWIYRSCKRTPSSRISVDIRRTQTLLGFQVNEHWLTLSDKLLRKTLNVTPTDSAHLFESPPAGKTDITFTRRRVPLNWLMKMKFNGHEHNMEDYEVESLYKGYSMRLEVLSGIWSSTC